MRHRFRAPRSAPQRSAPQTASTIRPVKQSQTIVQVRGLRKRYGKSAALHDVSFSVQAGEFVGLAGLNGAGKTTLIKCLLDFCEIDGGSIELFGIRHTEARARKQLTFLPERFVPPAYLSGREFLRYAASLARFQYDEQRVRAMLASLDLDDAALDRPVRAFSKGMTQKLGLAATFLAERELYILDEPMSGLDPKARVHLKNRLIATRQAGHAVFFTSHSLADIEELCDRVIVLHRGVPYFAGSPRQLCQDYGQVPIEQAFLRCIEAPPHGRNEHETDVVDRR